MEIGDLVVNKYGNSGVGLVLDVIDFDFEVDIPCRVAMIWSTGKILKDQLLADWEVIL